MDDGTEAVFVDPSGRRRRLARTVGIIVGCLLAAYLVVIATGLLTGSGAPFTAWPHAGRKPHAAPPARGAPAATRSPSRHPSASPDRTPRPRSTPTTTTMHTARPTPTPSGHGRGNGLTRSPNPRKPAG